MVNLFYSKLRVKSGKLTLTFQYQPIAEPGELGDGLIEPINF